jgi:hypothetical protein
MGWSDVYHVAHQIELVFQSLALDGCQADLEFRPHERLMVNEMVLSLFRLAAISTNSKTPPCPSRSG